jgi:hypothetical protein
MNTRIVSRHCVNLEEAAVEVVEAAAEAAAVVEAVQVVDLHIIKLPTSHTQVHSMVRDLTLSSMFITYLLQATIKLVDTCLHFME